MLGLLSLHVHLCMDAEEEGVWMYSQCAHTHTFVLPSWTELQWCECYRKCILTIFAHGPNTCFTSERAWALQRDTSPAAYQLSDTDMMTIFLNLIFLLHKMGTILPSAYFFWKYHTRYVPFRTFVEHPTHIRYTKVVLSFSHVGIIHLKNYNRLLFTLRVHWKEEKPVHFNFLNKILFIYLFIYFWLCWVFGVASRLSLVVASGGYSSLQCTGFSLRWLLLLWSTGSRHTGFSSCGLWAQ